MSERFEIPLSDFVTALKRAIGESNKVQEQHLLDDFWICTGEKQNYVLLKRPVLEACATRRGNGNTRTSFSS